MIVLTKILRSHIWMEDLIKSPPHTRDFSRELGGASIKAKQSTMSIRAIAPHGRG